MQFFTWQFMLFSLAVAGVTYVVRLLVEHYIKTGDFLKTWKDVILPIFPLALGCLMGLFMTKYPYPEGLVSSGGRVVFGMVGGMFSGLVYRTINSILHNKRNPPPDLQEQPSFTDEVVNSVRDSINK